MADPTPPRHGVDVAALDELAARLGAATAADLAAGFVEELRARIGRVEAALAAGDPDALATHAHALVSSAGTYGATALSVLSGRVESACRHGDPSGLAIAADLPGLLRDAIDRIAAWRRSVR